MEPQRPSPYYHGLCDTAYVAAHNEVEPNNHKYRWISTNVDSPLDPCELQLLYQQCRKMEDRFSFSFQTKRYYNPAFNVNIHLSSSNRHPLRALSRNHGHELKIDVNQDGGEACIDIWDEKDDDVDPTVRQITDQAWKEHIDQLKKSRMECNSMRRMSETAAALGGQAIGALVANAIANSTTSSWTAYSVEFVIVLGLCCTVAGISLREKKRALSVLITKIGAAATISAIIISLASHLPPVMTWTVGPVAFLILAVAVALA